MIGVPIKALSIIIITAVLCISNICCTTSNLKPQQTLKQNSTQIGKAYQQVFYFGNFKIIDFIDINYNNITIEKSQNQSIQIQSSSTVYETNQNQIKNENENEKQSQNLNVDSENKNRVNLNQNQKPQQQYSQQSQQFNHNQQKKINIQNIEKSQEIQINQITNKNDKQKTQFQKEQQHQKQKQQKQQQVLTIQKTQQYNNNQNQNEQSNQQQQIKLQFQTEQSIHIYGYHQHNHQNNSNYLQNINQYIYLFYQKSQLKPQKGIQCTYSILQLKQQEFQNQAQQLKQQQKLLILTFYQPRLNHLKTLKKKSENYQSNKKNNSSSSKIIYKLFSSDALLNSTLFQEKTIQYLNQIPNNNSQQKNQKRNFLFQQLEKFANNTHFARYSQVHPKVIKTQSQQQQNQHFIMLQLKIQQVIKKQYNSYQQKQKIQKIEPKNPQNFFRYYLITAQDQIGNKLAYEMIEIFDEIQKQTTKSSMDKFFIFILIILAIVVVIGLSIIGFALWISNKNEIQERKKKVQRMKAQIK